MVSKDSKEDRAIDALICLCLGRDFYEPTEEEIEQFMNDKTPLSPEDEAMLKELGNGLPDRMKEWAAVRSGAAVVKEERQCSTKNFWSV